MNAADIATLDWQKGAGLLPAIVQHAETGTVLMLGFMNEAALATTLRERRVTFFSRTRNRLWTKGESWATSSASRPSPSTATATRCW